MKDYLKILFPYAYNILGSSDDAKDAVQDVLSKFLSSENDNIKNEKNYLIKSVVNQSINIKKSRKRIIYSDDVWLPEPVETEEADTNINLRDIISYSLLILLEKLNPKERAVFILKEGFGYTHEEISSVLSSSVEHSRKLFSRAKLKLNQPKNPDKPASGTQSMDIMEKFIHAIREGNTRNLEDLLTHDIVFYADGGDKVNVVRKTCHGTKEVTELLFFVYKQFQQSQTTIPFEVNHQPALLYFEENELKACQVFSISYNQGKIHQINTLLDPGKLKSIQKSNN